MPRQYSNPLKVKVSASATVTTSSASSNLKNTTAAIPLTDAVTLFLDVTALSATSSVAGVISLDVYIDSSPDGGTTWYPSIHFAQVTASTNVQKAELHTLGLGPAEAGALFNMGTTINTTSTSFTSTTLSDDHRVRWAFNGSVGPSATFAIWALCADNGTYGA